MKQKDPINIKVRGSWYPLWQYVRMFKVKNTNPTKQIYMEDVTDIALEAQALIEKRLSKFGIVLDDGTEDFVYIPLVDAIEKVANYPDYRSHN